MRKTSRTWQAYSRADQRSSAGRRATRSAGRASTARQAAAVSRTMPATASRSMAPASKPHSGQGRSSTQVQSLVSGSIGTAATLPTVAGPGPRDFGAAGSAQHEQVEPERRGLDAGRDVGVDGPEPGRELVVAEPDEGRVG